MAKNQIQTSAPYVFVKAILCLVFILAIVYALAGVLAAVIAGAVILGIGSLMHRSNQRKAVAKAAVRKS